MTDGDCFKILFEEIIITRINHDNNNSLINNNDNTNINIDSILYSELLMKYYLNHVYDDKLSFTIHFCIIHSSLYYTIFRLLNLPIVKHKYRAVVWGIQDTKIYQEIP